jgi:hypothetical protein
MFLRESSPRSLGDVDVEKNIKSSLCGYQPFAVEALSGSSYSGFPKPLEDLSCAVLAESTVHGYFSTLACSYKWEYIDLTSGIPPVLSSWISPSNYRYIAP